MARLFCHAALLLGVVVVASGCPTQVADEQLRIDGTLERNGDGTSEDADTTAVPLTFLSEGARGQWWPCDMRMTATGCVDDHHVNVYISGPEDRTINDLGRGNCIVQGTPQGVYERMDEEKAGIYTIGQDFNVFVVIASDIVEPGGANFADDVETTAVSRLESGEVEVVRFRALEAADIAIRGTTDEGNAVGTPFRGPMTIPNVVPPLEAADTCVDAARLE